MNGFLKGFAYAFRGFTAVFTGGRNFRFMFFCGLLSFIAAIPVLKHPAEWAILAAAVGTTLCAEAFNCAIERMCDRVTKERDSDIKYIKDAAAAASLILSFFDIIIGILLLCIRDRFVTILNYCGNHPWYLILVCAVIIAAVITVPQRRGN